MWSYFLAFMKLKQAPDDFQVVELTDVVPGADGPFAMYRLEKEGWNTSDALAAIRRRWQLDLRRVSYGGLKDRHARTVQYLTVYRGPCRGLTHHTLRLTYLGQVQQPYTSRDIRANAFRVTLRSLPDDAITAAEQAVAEVHREGVPNYFDDQRFGSVGGAGGEFVARLLVLGRFEDALRLALTAPYEHDRPAQKKEKATLLQCWGDWPTCKERLPRGHARSLVDYLVHHPADFRGAVARLRPDLRGLYLSAYQSHLWNRVLARWLQQHGQPEQLIAVPLKLGAVPMHRGWDAEQMAALERLTLPLPSARWKPDAADSVSTLVKAVLAEEGFSLSEMKLKGLREPFFSKGDRAALCRPQGLEHVAGADELHAGQKKLVLSFELPRGSYATLIVKRVVAAR